MADEEHSPRIVVVGPCAAGKTTLVKYLRPHGFNIRSCAQEHSYVPRLWREFSRADILVFLDACLQTILRRLGRGQEAPINLEAEQRRLGDARSHCDLYLRTDGLTALQVAEIVEAFLVGRGLPGSVGSEHDS